MILCTVASSVVLTALPRAPEAATVDKNPESNIRYALAKWQTDFNARREAYICDLFAPDLRYDFYDAPERTYSELCARFHHALADTTQSLRYDLKIAEIIVSTNLAIVRLIWKSTATIHGNQQSNDEIGLDDPLVSQTSVGRSSVTSHILRRTDILCSWGDRGVVCSTPLDDWLLWRTRRSMVSRSEPMNDSRWPPVAEIGI
ncbi:nuclear transport factor 2 family protein [Paraburkholderia sp. C35]|uniref:nuclear transport factor 2 family protein n=1 Tax=Paraburkholderia sp. C35 TaxID=2126993 RepID=UPI0013A531C6|nr:nuclear transport factor 2 family protein [Paraburkholderia sp. C35]